jgi:hypothetical protein
MPFRLIACIVGLSESRIGKAALYPGFRLYLLLRRRATAFPPYQRRKSARLAETNDTAKVLFIDVSNASHATP